MPEKIVSTTVGSVRIDSYQARQVTVLWVQWHYDRLHPARACATARFAVSDVFRTPSASE
ncbi:hypothetical protein SAMN05443574_13714 [Haloarcula vallismortis]|uniref:Uncharacterized protein n=1 Tax=Haloarcula vallismortis TaxID=28442 RepID=A0A1H3B5S5_HALVA|nr:hypothetical protein SAMN05443574_13714 [Haloarcula vallismortis]